MWSLNINDLIENDKKIIKLIIKDITSNDKSISKRLSEILILNKVIKYLSFDNCFLRKGKSFFNFITHINNLLSIQLYNNKLNDLDIKILVQTYFAIRIYGTYL